MRNTRRGVIWLPWLLILLMIGSLLLAYLFASQNLAKASACEHNLRQIHVALELFELDRGALPKLSFFPADPLHGENSLRKVLADYGLESSHCICPSASESVVNAGLSYVWNVNMNNRQVDSREAEWLLMDIQAVHPKIPGPHFKRVHILYADGRIERTHIIPPGVEVEL